MKIDESFRKIMERNQITEKDLVNMVEKARKIAKEDLSMGE